MAAAIAMVASLTLAQCGTTRDAKAMVDAAAKIAPSERSMYCRVAASPPGGRVCVENFKPFAPVPCPLLRHRVPRHVRPVSTGSTGSVEGGADPGPRNGLEPGVLTAAPQAVVDLRRRHRPVGNGGEAIAEDDGRRSQLYLGGATRLEELAGVDRLGQPPVEREDALDPEHVRDQVVS